MKKETEKKRFLVVSAIYKGKRKYTSLSTLNKIYRVSTSYNIIFT